ncbi:alpha/beta fold hydrolase [Parvularcula sp. IMCC14364]|uniref:alpha/beta fold hydrolase n=1 Tax=Parvularcula sp. IMCC14364 TaxID=3067902 RepID=UPI002742544C|nr:alpha/beta hydrolase [Parvularcula sp. IMCC14364]
MIIALFLILIFAGLLIHGFAYVNDVQRRYHPTGKFLTVDGIRLHYLDLNSEAEGDPLLLIHGASSSLMDMKLALGDLAQTHRLILVDRPGCGFSDYSQEVSDLAFQAQLLDGLLQQLGIEKAVVIAQSLGTAIALSMAFNHRSRLSGLLLLAPVSHRWPGGVDWYNHCAVMPILGHFFRYAVMPFYSRLNASKVTRDAFWPNTMPENYTEKAQIPLVFRPRTFKANAETLIRLYPQIARMEAQYETLSLPLRMLAGTHDAVVLSTIHGMSLRNKVPGATLRYVSGVGHPLHHFCRKEIREELAELEKAISADA